MSGLSGTIYMKWKKLVGESNFVCGYLWSGSLRSESGVAVSRQPVHQCSTPTLLFFRLVESGTLKSIKCSPDSLARWRICQLLTT